MESGSWQRPLVMAPGCVNASQERRVWMHPRRAASGSAGSHGRVLRMPWSSQIDCAL